MKTVERIVKEKPWDLDKDRIPANKIVGVKAHYGEIHKQTSREKVEYRIMGNMNYSVRRIHERLF